ncbi:uncharacterized protein LOC141639890 [Silene latifolia]|uniref:uncharacterized protein LOC141639890 n=1 Tax=Silene latifolia TaxID=37657 RepID=UPI003D788DC9
MGAFNDTRYIHERNGISDGMRRRCNKFNTWCENNNWIDLDYSRPDHTWSRGLTATTRQWARLDRAMCNSEWRTMFAEGSLRHLMQNKLDHCPLIISTTGFAPIPKVLRPFRFQAAWMCHARFSEFVDSNWSNEQPLFPFIHNFANLLQEWNMNTFHNIFARKRSLERRLFGIQQRLSNRGPNYLFKMELKLKKQLDEVLREEELLCQESEKLDRNYVVADVQCVLNHMSPFKAPGPDGFQALFYQSQWETISPSLCKMIFDVLHNGIFPEGLGETFISLISKVDHPHTVSQFRPIGLCNVAYKLITKMIVNRLKPVLPILINPMQCSFVPERQITDNIIIVQEALHSMRGRKGRTGFMALKLDLEKPYDVGVAVHPTHTLRDMGIQSRMVRTIMQCIKSSTLNVLWNDERTDPFAPTRGIRQGNPLSPYIFTICMEKLSQLIEEYSGGGQWKGFQICRGGPTLTHLFFADDIILFGEATINQAQLSNRVLNAFCQASGQRVSRAKSKVYFSPNVDGEDVSNITNELQIANTDDLGMRFLWGGDQDNQALSLVSWDMVTKEKDNGGLGLRSMRQVNTAFMAKLGWRLLSEPNALWARVLHHKYCKGRCDVDTLKPKPLSSNVWNEIVESFIALKSGLSASIDIASNPSSFLMERIWEVKNAKESTDVCVKAREQRRHEIFVQCIAPLAGWVVLNIDGASKGNPGLSGAGCLIRDASGQLIKAFSEKLGLETVTRGEIMALRRGLIMALELQVTHLIIQIDSKAVRSLMDSTFEVPTAHSHMIQICQAFVRDNPWKIELHRIYRETNSCADWLVNRGVSQDVQLVSYELSNVSDQLFCLMEQDIGGVSWPRIVPFYSS